MFSEAEKSQLHAEIRLYQTDIDITDEMSISNNGIQEKCPLNKYWSNVFLLRDDLTH